MTQPDPTAPGVFVVMIGEFPIAIAATLDEAQRHALDGETKFQDPGKYEHRWDDGQRPGEIWRLLGRRAVPGRRFSATGRTVHALPATAVLPAGVDRADALREVAAGMERKASALLEGLDDLAIFVGKARAVEAEILNREAGELRRVAAETRNTTEHACSNCEGIDPDTCWTNPDRPPEQCPAAEFEDYGQQCTKPAGHNLHSFEEQQTDANPPAGGAPQPKEA